MTARGITAAAIADTSPTTMAEATTIAETAVLPPDTQALVAALLAFIDSDGCTDEEFDAMAVRVFAHQYAGDGPYRRFCQGRAITPRKVRGWRDLPAVPITAFKETTLSVAPVDRCERVFMTSGTTRAESRGKHHHPTLAVYDRSMIRNFASRFMGVDQRLPMAILFPDEQEMPNSSLAHYLSLAVKHFGAAESDHFVSINGADIDGFCRWLADMQSRGQPCAVLGASYGFVHMIDAFAARRERGERDERDERGEQFALPPGSRVLDTGGYKRQSRELPLDAFYDAVSAMFDVPRERCINMYGMTELSTQFYDDGNAALPSVKSGPHWIRSRAIDPLTGRDVPFGERGVLVHCDVANFNSTTTILTEDVGRMVAGGFELLGRVEGAVAKGCSLAVEAFLDAARGSDVRVAGVHRPQDRVVGTPGPGR